MSERRMNMLAVAVAMSVTCISASGGAQDNRSSLVERDARGDLTVRNDEAGFGEQGQLTISTDAALSIERRTQDGAQATTTLSILPAVDYFVIENLSVGGVVGVTYQKTGDYRATSFRLGPRVGYDFEISRLLSVWPKLGLSYAYNKQKNSGELPDGTDVSLVRDNNAVALSVFAPVMLHPAPHFFAGFGPFVDTDLNGDNRATTWGFRLTLGGWL